MSQQPPRPFRIVRIPHPAPINPSEGQPGASNPRPDSAVCPQCGAYVAIPERHSEFHANISSAERWMRQVNAFLRVGAGLPAEGDEPSVSGDNSSDAAAITERPTE